MSGEDEKARNFVDEHQSHHNHHHHRHHQDQEETQPYPPPPAQYGTFQGVPSYPPPRPPHSHPRPAMGFLHPVPPPGAVDPNDPSRYYAHGYQTVPGYAIAQGRPVRERRLPCCGIGLGWFLFIIGFLLAGIPWYVGAILLACGRFDQWEKPGYVVCTVAAILATIAAVIGATKGIRVW